MRRFGFALGVAALVVTAGSLPGAATGRFDQKLSKDKQVLHVLNRLTFGPRPGDVDRVRGLGVEKWIRQQLQPQLIAENPLVEARLRPLATLQLATWQIFETYQPPLQTALVNAPVPPQRPLAQLVSPEQLQKLSTGTPEERLAIIGAIPPENLGPVLAALTPKMLEGLPDLQKLAEKARQAEMSRQQVVVRSVTMPSASTPCSRPSSGASRSRAPWMNGGRCSCRSTPRSGSRCSACSRRRRSPAFPNCSARRWRRGSRRCS